MKKYFALLFLLLTLTVQARPSLLDKLGFDDGFDTPPDVDTAFVFSANVKDAHTLMAHWEIAEGNYLYKDKISFEIIDNSQVLIGPYSLPTGENKVDDIFGLSEVYHHPIDVDLPIGRSVEAQQVTLKARYQGCSETFNICYPPTEKLITLSLDQTNEMSFSTENTSPTPALKQPSAPVSSYDRLSASLAEDNLSSILLGFFGLGLLLAFTPCVFPMIPILSSIIVGEGERITTRRAFLLSLTYVLAMSVTYTAAGIMTGLLGENIQSLFQNPWIIGSFSALFVVLSLSMFGLYELQIPHALQQRLHQISHKQTGGHFVGAGLMGLLSGLIVGPCLAPPLAAALIFIGQQGDPFIGGSALFALSMGMGLPLLVIGTSAGTLLPKAGDWMTTIKSVFGVLMLALAIWMLERIIPGWISLLLWGGLLVVTAIYLGALNNLSIGASGWDKLWKGIGLLLLIYGTLLMIGAASGSHNVWQPLQSIASTQNNSPAQQGLSFTKINNLAELDQQLSNSDKPVLLDFYADWCGDCKTMELTTFRDTNVVALLANSTVLQLDMTDNTDEHKALLKHFGIIGPPTILFFNEQGQEITTHRLIGHINGPDLAEHLSTLSN